MELGASKMAQQIRLLAAKLDNLDWISGPLLVEEDKYLLADL